MIRTRVVLILAFVLAAAAGGALGLVANRALERRERGSWLGRQLDLTAHQREQMRRIWSDAMRRAREDVFEQRMELWRQRQGEIESLLTEEQKSKYDAIIQKFEQRQEELNRKRHAIFQRAHEQTREILNESQRKQFDRMLKQRPGRQRGPGPGFGPGRPGRGGMRPGGPPGGPGRDR